MPFVCSGPHCRVPRWMPAVLLGAALYHFLFTLCTCLWPHVCFDWCGVPRPNHPLWWRGAGWMSALFGAALLIAASSPLRHWPLVLFAFAKSSLVLGLVAASILSGELPPKAMWVVVIDDLLWWFPYAAILWATVQAWAGRPPVRENPLTIEDAARHYLLSSGETLAAASHGRTLAVVFLRHFGCTFTRRILRELEKLKSEADRHGARLVLVHMLQQGRETAYLDSSRDGVARISDPVCELYRAFGLGKGGFLELFGPRVWLPMLASLLRGCGMGPLAGDGLQMPGAFLFRDSAILSRQMPPTQAFLPDLPRLFETLPAPTGPANLPA